MPFCFQERKDDATGKQQIWRQIQITGQEAPDRARQGVARRAGRLAAGATTADIAAQEHLSPRRMRELTAAIFARRRIDAPDEFRQLRSLG